MHVPGFNDPEAVAAHAAAFWWLMVALMFKSSESKDVEGQTFGG